jgi:tetratricopeptide (TPR) repeat protein
MKGTIPEENRHIHYMDIGTIEEQEALALALSLGVMLNNEAHSLSQQGKNLEAIEKYEQAIAIKLRAHGEESVHICISLSGLCDAYLATGQLDKALEQTTRLSTIAKKIKSAEQQRIAKEIMADVEKALKA